MLSDEPLPPELSSGSETVRYCRTVHGPVEAREGDVAYARRYAIWGRELETLEGLAAVNTARSIEDVDRAAGLLTWNENLMAVDDRGNIGYWHPGLQPLRPRLWDERLPYPGSGEAEWRGMLPLRLRPWVINPRQGYLVQWNNVPSADWTSGDAPARPVLAGPFHRAAILRNRVAAAARAGGGYERTLALDRLTATTAQGRGPATARLRRARRGAGGDARVVLDTLLRWGGDYDRVVNGAVDPGVPAWDAFLDQARRVATGGLDRAVEQLEDGRSSTHVFDVTSLEAFALRVLSPRGYRLAAARALGVLRERFGSADPARWREQRRLYRPQPLGAAVFEPFPFFDRGTAEHAAELGP